ncbi:MAG: LysE family transporter [Caldilineaceae bacterium]|nr:LysE family transporter [Caldilineaceae bacterium]
MTSDSLMALIKGFVLCASLIVAFGPQNLFILQQGLRRQYLLTTALLSTFGDFVLIGISVGGLGAVIAANQTVLLAVTLIGGLFLAVYGVRSLCTALRPNDVACTMTHSGPATLQGAAVLCLGFSFLNPAAYVDTLFMIGGASGHYPLHERLIFGAGAVLASALWFFTLTYAASRLSPIFCHPLSWRLLNGISGCIMLGMSGFLFTTLPVSF